MALFQFPGGMSQTDWFGLGTGVLGTGYAAAAYNQAAYLGSLAMRQAQLYQAKNYHIGWIAVARDDIRNMMNISITRLTNYILVATLILGVASDALLGAVFDSKAPLFVQNAFWISIGLSILFFTMSIMFGVKGQNSAIIKTVRLLTWELRPENPSVYTYDYMQANNRFERTGLQNLFRVPGLRAKFHEEKGAVDGGSSGDGRRDDHAHWKTKVPGRSHGDDRGDDPGASSSSQGWRGWMPGMFGGKDAAKDAGGGAEDSHAKSDDFHNDGKGPSLEHVKPITDELLYLARFGHYMQLWQAYDTHSKNCIGLGLISLAQGAAYYTIAHLIILEKYTADFIIVVMVSIFSVLVIMVAHQNFHARFRCTKWGLYLLFALGPALGTAAALSRDVELQKWLAPCCLLCHFIFYTIGWLASLWEFKKPWETTKKFTTGPHGQEFPEEWMANMDCAGDPLMADSDVERGLFNDDEEYEERLKHEEFSKLTDVQRPTPAESKKVVSVANSVQSTTRQGLGFAAIAWLSVCGLTVLDLWPSLALPRFARGQGTELHVEEIGVAWPIPGFELIGLSCTHGHMFTANNYQVFEINTTARTAEALPCDIDQEILDVTAACDDALHCWPLVLLEDSSVVECKANGTTIYLLKGVEAQRIAIHSLGSGVPTVAAGAVVVSNVTALEMRWSEEHQGLTPLWDVHLGEAPEKITGVDYNADMAFIYSERRTRGKWQYKEQLQVVRDEDWSSTATYHLPYEFQGSHRTTGFCSMTSGDQTDFYMIQRSRVQHGGSARLLHGTITE